ncbi:MAG: DUF3253 domain-containing protein [Kiloniellales bacterium]|nr:DUF3253 domain-containing protein [Kiloniellales bacterium]
MSTELEGSILDLLSRRSDGASICPSEASRAVDRKNWRGLMEAVREAAWGLEARGRIVVLKRGRRIARAEARGPIRLALAVPSAPKP